MTFSVFKQREKICLKHKETKMNGKILEICLNVPFLSFQIDKESFIHK